MRLAMIAALSENRAIGKNNQLLWHLPADLNHFKTMTMGKPILMGRKTYQSIGKALPGRFSVVITRDVHFMAKGCVIVNSIENALRAVSFSEEVFVIGGTMLYQQLLPLAETLYLTLVHQEIEGDAFFPDIHPDEWREIARVYHDKDDQHRYAFSFLTLERISR